MRLLGWAAVVCVMTLCGVARAQIAADEFGIERFRLSTDGEGLLDVDSAEIDDHLQYNVNLAIGFAHEPLVVYDDQMNAVDPLVERRLTTDLAGSISLWKRVRIGVGATIVGYQSGVGGLTLESLPKGGIGDVRLVPKVMVMKRDRFAVALVSELTVPGGSARGWLRENGVTFAPAIAVSNWHRRVWTGLNVGYRVKPRVDVAGLVSDDEVFARVALAYTRFEQRIAVWWSTSLATPVIDANRNQVALETLVGGAYGVAGNVSVFAAGGVGLANGFGTPDWRALVGVRIHKPFPAPKPSMPQIWEVEGRATPIIPIEKPVEIPMGVVTGTVTSATGQPIPNATVTVGGDQLVTDDNGRFETKLAANSYEVVANADGYEQGTAAVTLGPDKPTDVTVTLQRKVRQGQLRGQVLSFGGQPVLGATITVGDKSVTSDSEGNYSIDLPAGAFEVKIEASGFQTQKRKVTIKLDAVTVLNADLRGSK